MTGEKNRGVSLEKLWNLDDKQLTTPKHDELVLSATPMAILNVMPDVYKMIANPDNWSWQYYKSVVSEKYALNQACEEYREKNGTNPKGYTGHYYGWEYNPNDTKREPQIEIIKNKIIDLSKLQVEDRTKFIEFLKTFDFTKACKCLNEQPIVGRNKFIIGYWDIVLSPCKEIVFDIEGREYKSYWCAPSLNVYIEAKPIVDSYGAVLRQIKTYCEYIDCEVPLHLQHGRINKVCLLTPDLNFKDAFEDQDIRVISI